MNHRRQFIWMVPATLLAGAAGNALAQPAKVDENDAAAKGLGYKHDGSKVDAAKYPSYAKDKKCGNCRHSEISTVYPELACPVLGKHVEPHHRCEEWA